ncbi:hypothetical protein ABZ619_38980 [Streptomyces sp. NPDC007851]|uniref:hypothetical protein n=1 Tax=Streptomyces sp. NPDC007851 TaxID=3155008 RepID=UPI0033C50525
MSKRDKQAAVFVGAIVGAAILSKVAGKEAKALGIPAGALAIVSWLVSQAI